MAETRKKVTFDFDDKGSLKKVKSLYDELMKTMTQSAHLYSQNNPGNPAIRQQKYLRDELNLLKELQKQRKADFEEKKRQLGEISLQEANIRRKARGRILTADEADDLNSLAKRRKDILSGTGYRKQSTFLKGVGGEVSSQDLLISKIEKTLAESNTILRSILANDKETALREIEAIQESSDSTPEQQLAAQQARAILEGREKTKKEESSGQSIIKDLFRFQTLNNALNATQGVLLSNSSVEAVRKANEAIIEMGIGGFDAFSKILGGVADRWLGKGSGKWVESFTMGAGRVVGAGARVGSETLLDSYTTNQEYLAQLYRNQALFGQSALPIDMSRYGYSMMDSAGLMGGLAKAAGTSRGISGLTRSAQLLERGAGVETGTIQELLQVLRSSAETDKNIEDILGGIWQQGQGIFQGDRTFFNEFTKNYTSLQRQMLQTQQTVSSGSVMSALNMFNSLGGQFGAKHQNSMGLISNIHSALSNPSGDAMDALTFTALRQQMPGASLGDILVERQRGLSSPNYFRAVMQMIGNMGGNETNQMLQVSSAFGINYEAARHLVRNRDSITSLSDENLMGELGNLPGMAANQTTQMERHGAELTDAKIQGAFDRLMTLIDQMKEVWSETWKGATYTVDPATGQLVVSAASAVNISKTPLQKVQSFFNSVLPVGLQNHIPNQIVK